MKYFITLLISLLVGLSYSQSEINFKFDQNIKLHPISLGTSSYQFSYEKYLVNRKKSFVISPTLIFKEGSQESRTGGELMGQYRFYLSHLNKQDERTFWGIYNFGLYASVYGLGYYLDETYTRGYYDTGTNNYLMKTYDLNVSSFELGTLLGVQIDFTERIVMDLYVGGGIRKSFVTDTYISENGESEFQDYSPFDPSFTGVKPKLGLSIGITI